VCGCSLLVYDSKIEHYRTPIVNDVIGYVTHTSKVLGEIKKSDFLNIEEKSDLVPGAGVEPARFPTGV
jgi:site-specific DNA recombinase